MTISIDSFVSFVSAALLVYNTAANSGFEWEMKPKTINPGERVTLEIRLPMESTDEDAIPPSLNDNFLYENKQLQVLDKNILRKSGKWIWQYQITAYSAGDFTIPPVQISDGGNTYSTVKEEFKVETGRAETDSDLRPDFGEQSLIFSWKKWIQSVLALGIFTALYTLFRRYRKKFTKKRSYKAKAPATPVEDPEAWLRNQLKALRERIAQEPSYPEALDEITRITREYYSKKTSAPATALTTQELFSRVDAPKLRPIFDLCDAIRFSGPFGGVSVTALQILDETEPILCPA